MKKVEEHWFAIHTRSRHEWTVRDQLIGKRIDAFLPTTFRWSTWRDRRKRIEWPLFPGYCFVRTAADRMLPIRSCVGVSSVVCIAGCPAPVPDYEIEAIQRLVDSRIDIDTWPFVTPGMPVRVVRGALTGSRGRFVRTRGESRLVLAVELLGQAVSVQIDAADVEPL